VGEGLTVSMFYFCTLKAFAERIHLTTLVTSATAFISPEDNFPENYNFPFAEQLKNQPYSISQTSSKDNLP